MWSKIKKCLGYLWASPVTAVGLCYVSLFQLAGWYKWHGVSGDSLVWMVDAKKSPDWLLGMWKSFGGQAIGNVIVLSFTPSERPSLLVHEQKHVDQYMRLGVFMPILYFASYVAIKLGCPGSSPYFSNPFEIDARRAAGQVIDVESTIKRLSVLNRKGTHEQR